MWLRQHRAASSRRGVIARLGRRGPPGVFDRSGRAPSAPPAPLILGNALGIGTWAEPLSAGRLGGGQTHPRDGVRGPLDPLGDRQRLRALRRARSTTTAGPSTFTSHRGSEMWPSNASTAAWSRGWLPAWPPRASGRPRPSPTSSSSPRRCVGAVARGHLERSPAAGVRPPRQARPRSRSRARRGRPFLAEVKVPPTGSPSAWPPPGGLRRGGLRVARLGSRWVQVARLERREHAGSGRVIKCVPRRSRVAVPRRAGPRRRASSARPAGLGRPPA